MGLCADGMQTVDAAFNYVQNWDLISHCQLISIYDTKFEICNAKSYKDSAMLNSWCNKIDLYARENRSTLNLYSDPTGSDICCFLLTYLCWFSLEDQLDFLSMKKSYKVCCFKQNKFRFLMLAHQLSSYWPAWNWPGVLYHPSSGQVSLTFRQDPLHSDDVSPNICSSPLQFWHPCSHPSLLLLSNICSIWFASVQADPHGQHLSWFP